jgi:histidinol-phosphate aminotransferase
MSRIPPVRDDLGLFAGYHSEQVDAAVRINTNESPFAPPEIWREALENALSKIDFNRYPDRDATLLRTEIARFHGVEIEEVFCANGSNEVLQCLLLAFGGAGRRVAVFEPTYALHSVIARQTGTEVVTGERDEKFRIDTDEADRLLGIHDPVLTFVCSPNNPTGGCEPRRTVEHLLASAPGLVVVDEAYVQFAPFSALELRDGGDARRGLVVVRTFSKTWAMAAARLGYLIADPEVVEACRRVALPYHLSAPTQAAGVIALQFRDEMESRVAVIAEERGRVAAALADLDVDLWPSDANFILFRPRRRDAKEVWAALVDESVLVRDCSSWERLDNCLRVTIGTPHENDRFLAALRGSVR